MWNPAFLMILLQCGPAFPNDPMYSVVMRWLVTLLQCYHAFLMIVLQYGPAFLMIVIVGLESKPRKSEKCNCSGEEKNFLIKLY